MGTGSPVLVLDADGRSGLACVQSLGRADIVVHAGVRDSGSLTERSRWCRVVHAQPAPEPVDEGVRWLRDLDRRFSFELVLPTSESALRWLCRLPEWDPLRAKATLPSNAALEAALDKERTYEIACGLNLRVPASRLLRGGEPAPPAEGPFPKVLKPARSKVVVGSRLMTLPVTVVRDTHERAEILAAWLPFTSVQEQAWVAGRGVGVGALYERGKLAWHFVHERLHEWPLTGGASTWRRACGPETELVAETRRLLDHLQWHGVAMVEWRRDESGNANLMEINPRLWGSLPLSIAAGVDIPLGLLALARNAPLPPAPQWRVGVTARNVTEDLRWLIENARADRVDPILLTQPTWRAASGWLRVLSGRESWDGWSLRDPQVALGEIADLARTQFRSVLRRVGQRAGLARARRRHSMLYGRGRASERPVSSVLFVCFGNICRSSFAATAARSRLAGIAVQSAGFHADEGRPTPRHVLETARTLDVDLSTCRSIRVRREQVDAADLIACMDLANLDRLVAEFPTAKSRSTLLGLFRPDGPAQINDPLGLSPAATRAVLAQILAALDGLAEWLTVVPP